MAKGIHRIVWGINEVGGKAQWTQLGVTFLNNDNSENVVMNYFPTDPKTTIQIREPKEKEENK